MLAMPAYAADQWNKAEPAGTRNVSDIDAYVGANNTAVDRLLHNYKGNAVCMYSSASGITVTAGSVMIGNSGGTDREMRYNSTDTSVGWTDLDSWETE